MAVDVNPTLGGTVKSNAPFASDQKDAVRRFQTWLCGGCGAKSSDPGTTTPSRRSNKMPTPGSSCQCCHPTTPSYRMDSGTGSSIETVTTPTHLSSGTERMFERDWVSIPGQETSVEKSPVRDVL